MIKEGMGIDTKEKNGKKGSRRERMIRDIKGR